MKDYARGLIDVRRHDGALLVSDGEGGFFVVIAKKEEMESIINERCAEAIADTRRTERKRAARIAQRHYNGGCGCGRCYRDCEKAMLDSILGRKPK